MVHDLVLFRKDCFTCMYKLIPVKAEPCKKCVSLTDQGNKFPLWEAED